jgi:hypothetical protein
VLETPCPWGLHDKKLVIPREKLERQKLKMLFFSPLMTTVEEVAGDQEGLFKLAIQLRTFFYSAIYNTATGYVLWIYLTDI